MSLCAFHQAASVFLHKTHPCCFHHSAILSLCLFANPLLFHFRLFSRLQSCYLVCVDLLSLSSQSLHLATIISLCVFCWAVLDCLWRWRLAHWQPPRWPCPNWPWHWTPGCLPSLSSSSVHTWHSPGWALRLRKREHHCWTPQPLSLDPICAPGTGQRTGWWWWWWGGWSDLGLWWWWWCCQPGRLQERQRWQPANTTQWIQVSWKSFLFLCTVLTISRTGIVSGNHAGEWAKT